MGCVSRPQVGTGVTVVVLPKGARGAGVVAGGAPATRETDVLDPKNTVLGPDAVVLTGGSAFGLRAADGVMQGLQQAGRGVSVGTVRVPIVVAAAIFDLAEGSARAPRVADGLRAYLIAQAMEQQVKAGRFGAGTGATVGKALGVASSMKGGQAAVTLKTADGLVVGALVVVNAVGSVLDDDGHILAGPLLAGQAQNTTDLWTAQPPSLTFGFATTLAVVATNADLTKAELQRVAQMAHDGLARRIEPLHSPWDGDSVFALSVGNTSADVGRVGAIAARVVGLAVRRAVVAANGLI